MWSGPKSPHCQQLRVHTYIPHTHSHPNSNSHPHPQWMACSALKRLMLNVSYEYVFSVSLTLPFAFALLRLQLYQFWRRISNAQHIVLKWTNGCDGVRIFMSTWCVLSHCKSNWNCNFDGIKFQSHVMKLNISWKCNKFTFARWNVFMFVEWICWETERKEKMLLMNK